MIELLTSDADGVQYISDDFGVNWNIFGTGGNISSFGTSSEGNNILILCSTDGGGILYSTNGGDYWESTNILDESWGPEVISIGDYYYVGSLSDGGILRSSDGKSWEKTDIGGGKWDESCVYYDKTILKGSGGKVWIKNSGSVEIISTSSGVSGGDSGSSGGSGGGISDSKSGYENKDGKGNGNGFYIKISEKLSNERLYSLIEYIITNVIKRDIIVKNTGRTKIDTEGQKIGTDLSDQEGKIVCASDDVYRLYKSSSIIDWENDLGMRPFDGITISDLIGSDVATEENIYDSVTGESDTGLLNLIAKVKEYINSRKSIYLETVCDALENKANDYKKIKDLTEDASMLKNNIEAYQIYMDAETNAAKILASSLADQLFYFDDYMVEMLINLGIFETIKMAVGNIKFILISLGEKAEKEKITIFYNPYEDKKLKYNFSKGLRVAFDEYLDHLSDNLIILTSSNDKDLISIAADYYKRYKREDYLSQVNEFLNNEEIDLSENYIKQYSAYDTDISFFSLKIKKIMEDETIIDKKNAMISCYNEYSFTFMNIEEKDIITDSYLELYFKIYKRICNELIFDYFSENSEAYEALDSSKRKRTAGYLNEIYEKFISRCKTLLNYSYDNVEYEDGSIINDINSKTKESILSWINNVSKSSDYEKLFYAGHIPTYTKHANKTLNSFIDKVKKSFNEKEGII